MGFTRFRWFGIVIALLIGVSLEMTVLFGVFAASPQSHVEPGSPDWKLVEWTHEPSWHIAVGGALVAPTFFDDKGNAFLVITGLQAIFYATVTYLLFERMRRERVSSR
jgi:hypothetical protein